MLFEVISVFLLSCMVDAAPRPRPSPSPSPKARPQGFEVFQSGSLYPNYYLHQPPPFAFNPYPNPFYHGTYVQNLNSLLNLNDKKNGTGTGNGNDAGKSEKADAKNLGFDSVVISPPILKPEDLAAFKSNFPKLDFPTFNLSFPKPEDLAAFKTRVITFEGLDGINIVNPFIAGKTVEGKIVKAENGVPVIKAGKSSDSPSKDFSVVNPFTAGGVDPVFGPEIAPRYEIHYTTGENYNFDDFPFNFAFSPFGDGFLFGTNNKNGTVPGTGHEESGSKKPELADSESTSAESASTEMPFEEKPISEPNGDATTTSSPAERKRRQFNKRTKTRH